MRSRLDAVRRNGDEGFSLIELLVSMIVFGISIGMVYAAAIAIEGRTSKVEASAEAVSQVRQALAQMDRQVRSGNVLYAPGNEASGADATAGCTTPTSPENLNKGTCMRVYTQANGAERCVQWRLRPDTTTPGRALLESRSWQPAWQTLGAGSVSDWDSVARGLSAAPDPFTLQGGGTAYGARLLDVRLEAVDPRRGDPVVLTSSLSGRNTNYGYDAGQCTPVPPA
jgi:prepilin-type N-terminal cleavage/methylation domain-containing protein